MDEDIMELIMDYYLTSNLEFIDIKETKEGAEFYNYVISPVWDCNTTIGRELENKYVKSLCAFQRQSFRNGFLACKHFLLECLKE